MPTNQQRREAVKRKLERQQERRVENARKRKRNVVVTAIVTVVGVVAGVVLLTTLTGRETDTAAPSAAPCQFTPTPDQPAAKPVSVPDGSVEPEKAGIVAVVLKTNRGDVPLTLDRAMAPCTVESFLHLLDAKYFDGTPCHRLTTGTGIQVLQCGDPTGGTGPGGPGYTIGDEKPVDLAPSPAGQGSVIYTRGLLAMANTGQPDSGSSQFFLVYGDSTLSPDYTVFGTISAPGLAVIDGIAAGGVTEERQPGDGKPATEVRIEQAALAS